MSKAEAAKEKAEKLLELAIKALEEEDLPKAYALCAASGLAGGFGEYMAQTNGKGLDIVTLGRAIIPSLKGPKVLKKLDKLNESKFDNITKKQFTIPNFGTNRSSSEIADQLQEAGYSKRVSADGKSKIFEKGDKKYTIGNDLKSTNSPAMEVFVDGVRTLKIRLDQ